jgi:serine/arginine repetitive matrix protein 2
LNDDSVPYSSSDLPEDLQHHLNGTPRKQMRHLSQQVSRPSGQQGRGQSRHASYGGGDSAAKMSTESLALGKARKRSFSRSSSRDTDHSDKEGRRGIMGNVRRISLVGKHRRAKSGAEGTGIPLPPPLPSKPEPTEEDGAEEPPGMKTPSKSRSHALLPPIELQPPSPPRLPAVEMQSPLSLEPVFRPPKAHSQRSPSPTSKAASSLGRTTTPSTGTIVPRRNSLGDLKIPARISQAQVSLKRDLGMVRDFALEVERKSCII